jgi:hypothetical protein
MELCVKLLPHKSRSKYFHAFFSKPSAALMPALTAAAIAIRLAGA